MRKMSWIAAMGALLAGLPAAAAAQETQSAQAAPAPLESYARSFTWLGSDLRVTVTGEAPGSIQVLRGEPGRLDVSASALGGLPAAALGAGSPGMLTLASAGSSRVDYVLIVPEDTRVTIALPGQPGVTLGTLDRVGTWKWAAQAGKVEPLPQR